MKPDTALVVSKPLKLSPTQKVTKPLVSKEDKDRVIETPWDAMDDFFGRNEMSAVWGKLFRKIYIQKPFQTSLSVLEDMCFLADYLSVCKGKVRIIPQKGYIYYIKDDTRISYEKFDMMKEAYQYVAQKMEEAGCKEVPALKGKYLNHYAKNYLKLSSEEQNSEYGLELKERYKKEVSEMAGHYHINMTNRLLYLAMTTNPEFMGNILIQGRDNLYRLNRTIR